MTAVATPAAITKQRAWALMAVHVAFAAGTYVLTKPAAVGLQSAAALCFVRALIASCFLGALCLSGWIPKLSWNRRDTLLIAVLGALLVFNQFVYLYGMRYTAPGHAPLLYALTPSGVMLLSAALRRRWPPAAQIGGVAIALCGVFVLLRPWKAQGMAADLRTGDLWIGVAVLAWVIYTVCVRSLIRRHDSRTITAWTLILGTIAFVPVGLPAALQEPWHAVHFEAWIGILWLALITSVAMMLLWNRLLQHLEPVAVAICANAQPPATALLAAILTASGWLRGDPDLGLLFWLGMGLILAGVIWVQIATLKHSRRRS